MRLNCIVATFVLVIAVVNAVPNAKNFSKLKILAGGTAASFGYYFFPYLQHLEKSDESLRFWIDKLRTSPEADFLFRHDLIPQFVIDGRFEISGDTVYLNSLHYYDSDFLKKLLSAGADPNVASRRGRDFFEYARRYDFPPCIVEDAIARGLDVNHRNKNGKLPLDQIITGKNYEVATVLVKAGAESDRSWYGIILELPTNDYSLPSNAEIFKTSELYITHRLVIEIYRASGRDKSILEGALWRSFWQQQLFSRRFLLNIDQFDQMLS